MLAAWLSVLLTLCIAPVAATCPGIVRYNARNMTNVTCPTNAFSCSANDVQVDTVAASVLPASIANATREVARTPTSTSSS